MAMRLGASSFTAAPVTGDREREAPALKSIGLACWGGMHGTPTPPGLVVHPRVRPCLSLPANECGGRAGAAINNQ